MARIPTARTEVVVEVGDPDDPDLTGDVVVPDERAADEVVAAVSAHPLAATALAILLRGAERRTIDDGLAAESACYSMLQAGPEFQGWLAARARRSRPPDTDDPVRVERADDRLRIALHRPHVRNAFSAAMREGLLDALAVAAAEPVLTVELVADGPDFCSGGDLDEFGSFTDPASAHLIRLERSAGRALAAVADRTTAYVHGACIGAGVELPAFAGRVVAAPDATFALPEVAMGLVPGAGGTVGLTRRIGRHRTAALALSADRIDAAQALDWGLIDALTG